MMKLVANIKINGKHNNDMHVMFVLIHIPGECMALWVDLCLVYAFKIAQYTLEQCSRILCDMLNLCS